MVVPQNDSSTSARFRLGSKFPPAAEYTMSKRPNFSITSPTILSVSDFIDKSPVTTKASPFDDWMRSDIFLTAVSVLAAKATYAPS